MPPELVKVGSFTYGTTADTKKLIIASGRPINALFIMMKSLENTTTDPSNANILAQLGTTITVKKGNDPIVQFAPDDWAVFHERYTGTQLKNVTGGGTDNRVQYAILAIPFGRFFEGMRSIYGSFIDPLWGLRTEATLSVENTFPADANNLDGREFHVFALYNDECKAEAFLSRVAATITGSGTGWKEALTIDELDTIGLYDTLFFQTTELSAGVTADTTTLESIRLYLDGSLQTLRGDLDPEVLDGVIRAAGAAGGAQDDDEYPYINFGGLQGKYLAFRKLRLEVNYGDTNAARVLLGLLKRNN